MDARYRIRPAALADAAALVAIERRCFSDPWSEAAFREALSSEWTFTLVADSGRGPAGYLIGREAAGSGEILNLAVAPEFRRRGIGGALLEDGPRRVPPAAARARCFSKCASRTTRRRRSTWREASVQSGQRAAYYRNPREDALVLRLALRQHA